jgi:hypothetical protein
MLFPFSIKKDVYEKGIRNFKTNRINVGQRIGIIGPIFEKSLPHGPMGNSTRMSNEDQAFNVAQ